MGAAVTGRASATAAGAASARADLRLHRPAGSLVDGADPVRLAPDDAGWRYTGLRVVRLSAGGERVLETADAEMIVLPLGGACTVETGNTRFSLLGRPSVFDAVSDFAYVPIASGVRIASDAGGEFALLSARTDGELPPRYGAADRVPVEVRGGGRATRQLTNFCLEETFPAARLAAVEVLAPGGNWSSYPPHKHDDASVPGETVLEEIYYFRIQGESGFGLHRTYAADGEFDETVTVHDGDVFLVPRGYHGPCAAAPGFPMYYLNVLAGPGGERTLGFSDDPAYAWIRESLDEEPPDPRLPMTGAR